jgi:SulP family sulfate permease
MLSFTHNLSSENSPLLSGKAAEPSVIDGVGLPTRTPNDDLSPDTPTIDRRRRTSVIAIATAEAIVKDRKNRRLTKFPFHFPSLESIGSLEVDEATQDRLAWLKIMHQVILQIPAVLITVCLNFMMGIPFGASYFPTELQLQGKEVLGLRMFLFSTMMAQFIFTFESKFDNAIGLQMVENVPFCLELARIVISEQSCEGGATSTLFFLFGFSSVLVGLVFYLLGRLEMGRIVYFFPSHVLVGCIGGLGAFIIVTAIEVSTNTTFTFTVQGFNVSIIGQFNLLLPVLMLEIFLRLIIYATKGQYSLLPPVFYCMITPLFYATLFCLGINKGVAEELGYFFPPINSSGSAFSWSLVDIFTEISFLKISWKAVKKAIPTIISLTAFSSRSDQHTCIWDISKEGAGYECGIDCSWLFKLF